MLRDFLRQRRQPVVADAIGAKTQRAQSTLLRQIQREMIKQTHAGQWKESGRFDVRLRFTGHLSGKTGSQRCGSTIPNRTVTEAEKRERRMLIHGRGQQGQTRGGPRGTVQREAADDVTGLHFANTTTGPGSRQNTRVSLRNKARQPEIEEG